MATLEWFQGKLGNVVFTPGIYSHAQLTFKCSISEKEEEYYRLISPGGRLRPSLACMMFIKGCSMGQRRWIGG